MVLRFLTNLILLIAYDLRYLLLKLRFLYHVLPSISLLASTQRVSCPYSSLDTILGSRFHNLNALTLRIYLNNAL